VTSIFHSKKGGRRRTLYIHTEDEQRFSVMVRHGGSAYSKDGFSSFFEAYDHGCRMLAAVR
jgi:hypothetical protein